MHIFDKKQSLNMMMRNQSTITDQQVENVLYISKLKPRSFLR